MRGKSGREDRGIIKRKAESLDKLLEVVLTPEGRRKRTSEERCGQQIPFPIKHKSS